MPGYFHWIEAKGQTFRAGGFNGSHKETHARDWAVKVLSRGGTLGEAFKALREIAMGLLEIWMAGRWGRKPDSGSEGCDGRSIPV